jgi:hypothetical protein
VVTLFKNKIFHTYFAQAFVWRSGGEKIWLKTVPYENQFLCHDEQNTSPTDRHILWFGD